MGYESSSNHSDYIPSSIDEVIRAIPPVAWLDNPLPRPQHVVTDNYSPASPVYSPDHSPIQIDSDEEEVEFLYFFCSICLLLLLLLLLLSVY